jgi:hypothetical protein
MGREFNIPWKGFSLYQGTGVNIPWVRYTIESGFDIPLVGQNTMSRGFNILWIGDSICHGYGGQNTIDRGRSTMGRG